MDKIKEFVAGVQYLAPGLVVGIIFYMYSDVKFDQFGFLLFCAVAIILISLLTDAFLRVIAAIYSIGYFFAVRIYAKAVETTRGKTKKKFAKVSVADALMQLNSARLASQLALAVVLGILFVGFYQNDMFYRWFGGLTGSPKISQQDTLHYVLKKIANKEYDYVDGRPGESRACPPLAKDCSRDVYLRIRSKDGDLYEGAMLYFPAKLEVQGFYLSPACVARTQDKKGAADKQGAALEKIAGPGVYLSVGDVAAIEYVDLLISACFAKYYPELAKKSEDVKTKQ
ncbi:hypothetical protein ACVWYH_009738 [Bradyrhizobium sp. GM24.11]